MVMIINHEEFMDVLEDVREDLTTEATTQIMSDTRNRRVELQMFIIEGQIWFRVMSSDHVMITTHNIMETISTFNFHASCNTLPRIR